MNTKVNGLRIFLLSVLSLMANGCRITCTEIEDILPNGIATALYCKYPQTFRDNISTDSLADIDNYYKKWSGCANGEEMRKYITDEDSGLQLLIALALNEIY